MSVAQKLIRKVDGLAIKIKNSIPGYDKINLQEEVLSRAVGSKKVVLEAQRRDDSDFGLDVVAQKIKIAILANASQIDRHDFGTSDYALRLLLNNHGVAQVQTITTVADVSGSLNNTYFLLNSADNSNKYYIWINVDSGGTDPMIADRTGLEVDISSDDTANTIAIAVASAIAGANSGNDFTAPAPGANVITVTNKADGLTDPMLDDGATGFALALVTQGVDDRESYSNLNVASGDLVEVLSGSLKGQVFSLVSLSGLYARLDKDISGYVTETNIPVRFLASTVKPSYT